MTFRRRPTVDTPLGDLIAGRINQAEYRRRIGERNHRRNAAMPDRARLELRVDPEPVRRRRLESGDSGAVFVWIGAMTLLLIVAYLAFLLIVALTAPAPRSAQTTLLVDVSGQRSAEPTPAPRSQADGGAPSSPAAVNVTASEGPQGPTTPMPAARYRGLATWFCLSGRSACTSGYGQDDLVAAIDTDLGFGKGDRIRVRYGDRSVLVTVVDVCRCPGERLVDLTSGAFARLADLDVGVIPVTLELAGPGATLPATETTP